MDIQNKVNFILFGTAWMVQFVEWAAEITTLLGAISMFLAVLSGIILLIHNIRTKDWNPFAKKDSKK